MPDNHETPAFMSLPTLRLMRLGASLLMGTLASTVGALGLDQPLVQSRLGQALELSVPLSLAVNEAVSEQCLRAELQAGEARIPAGLLQLKLVGEPPALRVQVKSLVRIEESPLQLTLAIGCPSRLSRDFLVALESGPVAATPASSPALARPALRPQAAAPVTAAPPAPLPSSASAAPAARPAAARERPPASRPPQARRATPPQPRLRLEAPEILVAPTLAASAPPVDESADLEKVLAQLEAQVAELQAEIKAQRDGAASAPVPEPEPEPASAAASAVPPEAIPEVTPQPARRRARYADPLTWLWTLGLMLVAGAAGYAWMARQDRRRQQDRQALRELAAGLPATPPAVPAAPAAGPASAEGPISAFAPPVESGPVPLPNEGQTSAVRAMPWPRGAGSPPAPAFQSSFQSSHLDTQPLERRMSLPPPPPAPVAPPPVVVPAAVAPVPVPPVDPMAAGVDALLELQQQAEFLALLGQHDALADLLTERVHRESGGPMPYLMLLELCQQRGEAEAFAELARRYEQRFGGLAPSWQNSISRGRSLDACPSVIAHLQVVWADPPTALRMLIELIARGNGPGAASFDLPAYRDLLALYAVARDLYETALRGDGGGVDFELPGDSRL